MSTLMRSPRECGSWFWDLEEVAEPGLNAALAAAAQMCDVLSRLDLLVPARIEYKWFVPHVGATGISSSVTLSTPLGDPRLAERVIGSRPSAFPDAEISDVHVIGSGTWVDASGKNRREPRLIDVSVSPSPLSLSAEMSVHHDIWAWYDFAGQPHPEVYRRNAPRLTTALQELNTALGVDPEPGEPTYFGAATAEGIATPDADDDGLGPDLTARL